MSRLQKLRKTVTSASRSALSGLNRGFSSLRRRVVDPFSGSKRKQISKDSRWDRIRTSAARQSEQARAQSRFVFDRAGSFFKGIRSFWDRAWARLGAWRDRWRRISPDDEPHVFRARSYAGSRTRRYVVHKPRSITGPRPRPLVVVLHGCRQDNRDIESISGFNRLADRHGFLVAYPYITSYSGMRFQNCWGWWFDREIHAGRGEVEDLWQIVEEIKQQYPVNERRIHVTGLSSGAGMTIAMLVAHADKIASGSSVAGVPYTEDAKAVRHPLNPRPRNRPVREVVAAMKKELGSTARTIPLKIVHSIDDETVDIQSAKNLRDSWGQCFGIDTERSYNVSRGRTGKTTWECNMYRNSDGNPVIESLFLEGPGHGWYGGNPGAFSYPEAPDISSMIWKFFKSHPLPR